MRLIELLLLLAPLQVLGADPNGFLSPRRVREVKEELRGVLDEVLGGGHGMVKKQVDRIEHVLKPFFKSLPKNRAGRLSAPVMRYVVQRYFSEQNSWILKGFEAHSVMVNVSDFSDGAHMLQGKLPEYIVHTLEEKFSSNGFGLQDAAGMIAALETLTFDEVLRGMQKAFELNSISTKSQFSHKMLVDVVTSYLIIEMLEGDSGDAKQHKADKDNILELYPHWETTMTFLLDVVENDGYVRQPRSNPFRAQMFSFEDTSRIAQRITEQFGPWSSHECHEIKDSLVEMDIHGTGRVKLSEFYASSKDGRWQFREASEYLRQLGALDESSPQLGPLVIIPNYVQGLSNCITSTPYYSVCCQNECNEVYQHLEMALPVSSDGTWSMDHIAGAVEGISDQNISASAMVKLHEIDTHHHGKIPLHGRLLAQWLHFVFPRECPYPHMAQTINPQTPARWEASVGQDAATATDSEVEQFLEAEAARVAPSPDAGITMWNPHEVTLHSATPSDLTDGSVHVILRTCAIFGLMVSLAALILKELLPRFAQVVGSPAKSKEVSI